MQQLLLYKQAQHSRCSSNKAGKQICLLDQDTIDAEQSYVPFLITEDAVPAQLWQAQLKLLI